MSDIIQLLPDSIANQIAAGEVIQRPASVVKELLENAIDAKSTSIQVVIKDAGKGLIQVIDNGIGMSATDARMSFERHATSKIRKAEDLFFIKTMGFRGEAMASIAAVAQVELKTRLKEEELGTCIQIEGSYIKNQEPVACLPGTTVLVKNLFFNLPARRNFLKSNAAETRHIIDEFQRVALAHPDIAFSFYQQDLEVYNLKPGKLSQRIIQLFGKNYKEQLASCQEETPLISVKGYLGKPKFAKKTRGEQFFFVNKRFIKNHYLNHAIKGAYEGLIADDCHPFYVLFMEIDPKHIDVNVHPTKTEIKFDDERTIYGIIKTAAKQALGAHNLTPSLDFEQDVNVQIKLDNKQLLERDFSSYKDYQQEKLAVGFDQGHRQKSNLKHWHKLFDSIAPDEEGLPFDQFSGRPAQEEEEAFSITFESAANNLSINQKGLKNPDNSTFQLQKRYIVTPVKSGLMIIDQNAAHERILYERYLMALQKKKQASQQHLFPQTIKLNPADMELVMELKEEIHALGFVFDIFGKNSIVINGIPGEIVGVKEKEAFEGLIEQYKFHKAELSLDRQESMARAMARQSAIKAGQHLAGQELQAIIDQLFACSNPNYTPGGKLIFYMLNVDQISSFFNK